MKKILMCMMALLSVAFIGCKEDGPEPNVWDKIIGEYSGSVDYYFVENGVLVPLDFPHTVTFSITKPTKNSEILILMGDAEIEGVGITKVNNGFGFELVPFTSGGYLFYGYDGVSKNGMKYHGKLESGSIEFYYQYQSYGHLTIAKVVGFKVQESA